MKCYDKRVLLHIKVHVPASLDPHQLAFPTDQLSLASALHSALTQLGNNKTYMRKVFVGIISVFSTITPLTLDGTLLVSQALWASADVYFLFLPN